MTTRASTGWEPPEVVEMMRRCRRIDALFPAIDYSFDATDFRVHGDDCSPRRASGVAAIGADLYFCLLDRRPSNDNLL